MSERECRVCGVVQPLSEFHLAATCRDGHRWTCKACRRQQYRDRCNGIYVSRLPRARPASTERAPWQERNREHYRQYQAAYHRDWAKRNRERISRYRANHLARSAAAAERGLTL